MNKILVIDEKVFTKVCRAILELEGYIVETRRQFLERLTAGRKKQFGLVITSYPFCIPLIGELEQLDVPKIIFIDHLHKEVINMMGTLTNSFCMIKPIDFNNFRLLVQKILMDNKPTLLHITKIL